jgi:signal transduction histidine kinase
MRASLDELQALTEAALEAARSGAGEEAAREVDVAALVESLCADLSEMGGDVVFAEAGPVTAVCRPHEIKRAARNLIENALKYGKRARVSIAAKEGDVGICVDDDGPGLSVDEALRVFEPFARLNASNVTGLGLGLTLARAVARGHGGDVVLENREGGGLRAMLSLKRVG